MTIQKKAGKPEMNKAKKTGFSSVADLAKVAFHDDLALVEELESELSARQVVRALFAMRSARGVSQAEIASQLSCSQSRVSKIENGVDADLSVGELEAYAKALDCDVVLTFQKRHSTAVDRVKQHAFAIKRELDTMAKLAGNDSTLQKGVASFFGEAFFNIVRLISESAKSLPELGDDSPHVRVSMEPSETEMIDDQVQSTGTTSSK
jgi:transcriptional regulator with XRE-family HTH domain